MGGKGGLVDASGMEGMIELSFSSLNEKVDKAIAEKRDDLQAIQANECNEEDVCGEQQIREQLEELMRKEEIMWD
ncbi:hypothetical protein CFP56_024262 [Quercus suber]|uniref:Uncharacterized protein n=1 Tax=Quercus suber TaxID=58331 RepID=A0AAW0MCE6_QUESU